MNRKRRFKPPMCAGRSRRGNEADFAPTGLAAPIPGRKPSDHQGIRLLRSAATGAASSTAEFRISVQTLTRRGGFDGSSRMHLGASDRLLLVSLLFIGGLQSLLSAPIRRDGAYHVSPGDDLQEAVDLAARDPNARTVIVHAGTYSPKNPGQALVFLNRAHDGVHLLGEGRPILTAANPVLATTDPKSAPAVVNHVIYLGDGLSSNTVVQGLRLTGANHFITTTGLQSLEPDQSIRKGRFFFGDGGAIKIYHRSFPTLRDLVIEDNNASPCAGGISIQHEGATNGMVRIERCIFRNNHAEVTGAALDLLWGSSAWVSECLFEGNVSNTGPGEGENPFNNNGVVTVFPRSRIVMQDCTFSNNRNGVDDQSGLGTYERCVFRSNTRDGGFTPQPRFELDLPKGGRFSDCVLDGPVMDPTGSLSRGTNHIIDAGAPFPAGVRAGYPATGHAPK